VIRGQQKAMTLGQLKRDAPFAGAIQLAWLSRNEVLTRHGGAEIGQSPFQLLRDSRSQLASRPFRALTNCAKRFCSKGEFHRNHKIEIRAWPLLKCASKTLFLYSSAVFWNARRIDAANGKNRIPLRSIKSRACA
jgi:hypothetical protein